MLKILLKLKDSELKTIETDSPEITIGRSKKNDIHLNNLGVSKKHARIFRHNGCYLIEDLQSTNGTFLQKEKIHRATLNGDEVITIGKYSLCISFTPPNPGGATSDIGEETIVVNHYT